MSASSADRLILPDGVRLVSLPTSVGPDGRTLGLYDTAWAAHDEPLVYTHAFTILPGRAKGWGRHEHHDDRYALLSGSIEIALCDMRMGSATRGAGVIIPVHDGDRQLVVIPRGVWHATRNVGETEAIVVDFPTRPYCHEAPDKYVLPLDTDELPMRLGPGWLGY